MFERFTERARRVLFFARYEASQLGSISIESEHLLLGLIREGKGLTGRIFARHRTNLAEIRSQIEGRSMYREKISTSVEIPFSTDSKTILQFCADEADRLLHNYIGTEHMLLGILRQERSAAAMILMEKGLRLQGVRDEIVQLLSEKGLPASEDSSTSGDAQPLAEMMVEGQPLGFPDLPSYVPSNTLHVSHSRRHARSARESSGPRHWIMAGVELTSVIVRAYGADEGRLELPVAFVNGKRYDIVLLLPRDESAETIAQIVQHAIEAQFEITVTRETRADGEIVVVRPK